MSTLVSVLVPVYNVEKYFKKCLLSLFKQTYPTIEYIFVDDCSTDSSIQILNDVLKDFPNRINNVKIISHSVNRGLAVSRNTALNVASGDYIIHIDSDDYIEYDMIASMIEKATKNNSDMVICDFYLEYPQKTVILKNNFSNKKKDYLEFLINRKTLSSIVARLIKRSVVVDNNIFFIEGLNQGEDYVTSPRVTYYCNVINKVETPLYHYIKFNLDSYTHNIDSKTIDDVARATGILIDFFSEKGYFDKTILDKCVFMSQLTLLYTSDYRDYSKIREMNNYFSNNLYTMNLYHSFIFFLLEKRQYKLLYYIIMLVNKIRKR